MHFELLLFSTEPAVIVASQAGGVGGFIVDRENAGKRDRQIGRDTQINNDSVEDLERTRCATDRTVICRVNGMADPERCLREIDEACAAGADEILLPMVTRVADVETVLNRCRRIGVPNVGILIETIEGVELAPELGRLPLKRVYVGLTDLAVARGIRNIFVSLVDGTVESADTVCLSNGARVPAASELAAGTKVAVSVRPERTYMHARGGAPQGLPTLDGRLTDVTYLGNALVYTVALDWMTIEVRSEATHEPPAADIGDDVTVSWEPGAVSVVTE